MARLDLDLAPPTAVPRRFLLAVPAWGGVAGLILLGAGESALVSRWGPATLALVHSMTLGVLGNAMFGSLLQFLPAAAGIRPRGGRWAAWAMFVALNAGAASLVAGFLWPDPAFFASAAGCLAAAFGTLACACLPGLWQAGLRRLPQGGIALAIAMGVATACLGIGMLPGRAGWSSGPPSLPWANVHAAWGLLGWVLVLLASVGQVVVPMFQGAKALHGRVLAAWLIAGPTGLAIGAAFSLAGDTDVLRIVVAVAALAFAATAVARQGWPKHRRNPALTWAWRTGLCAIALAAAALAVGAPPLVTGALVLALGLPLPLIAMLLEITAFLGWIEMHRRCGRGVRLPGVDRLLPESRKALVLGLHALAGTAVVAAAAWPAMLHARAAGVLLLAAHLALVFAISGVARRIRPVLLPNRVAR